MFSFSPIKKNLDSIAFAAAGSFIIYLYTRHSGIGISPDSVVYASGAESIRSTGHFLDYKHEPIVDFPVFYPLFLAGIMLVTGLKILAFASWLNAFLFALVIFLSGNIMEQFEQRSRWWKAAVLSCIAISPALLEDYSMLWSETFFILLLLLFVMAVHRYLQTVAAKSLITAGIIAGLICITRYAGITALGTGGLLILLNSKLSWRKRFIHATLFGLIGAFFLIINLYRNYELSKTLTGFREPSNTPLITNIYDAGSVLVSWLPFLKDSFATDVIIAIAVVAGLSFICLKKIFKERRIASYESIPAFFALAYILFLIITATFSRFETLNSRFLSPVFIFLLWAATGWMVASFRLPVPGLIKWFFASIAVFILIFFQRNQVNADLFNWEGIKDAGIPGYTEDGWTKSETVQFIQHDSFPFKKDYTIYSDAPDAVWWFARQQDKYLPRKENAEEVQDFLENDHCYVIWFNDGENSDLVDKKFLVETKKMKLVKELEDGEIFEYEEGNGTNN